MAIDHYQETWRAVARMSLKETEQWLEEHKDELPYLLAWLLGYAGLSPKKE